MLLKFGRILDKKQFMKTITTFYLLVISFSFFSQVSNNSFIKFGLKDKKVILYEDIRYHSVDTLERLNRMYEVYLMKVDSCVPNFCRVKGYYTVPYLKGKKESMATFWVESENLESALSNHFSIYKEPFSTTKENLKLKVEDYSDIYFKVTILNIKKDWVKIKFTINDQELIGWVNSNALCPLKHEECHF